MAGRTKTSSGSTFDELTDDSAEKRERRKTLSETGFSASGSRITFDEPERPVTHSNATAPPAYGDDTHSALALPVTRLSESSRSDGSSADHGVYATTTTTTHTVSTTTFFRMPRRKKQGSLFPLPDRITSSEKGGLAPPRGVTSGTSTPGTRSPGKESATLSSLGGPHTAEDTSMHGLPSPLPSPSHSALARSSMNFAAPGAPLLRNPSNASSRSSPVREKFGLRGRSSTLSSLRGARHEEPLSTPPLPSGRPSISNGRKSFGDLFGLSHRLRQNSEPPALKQGSGLTTPASLASQKNSIQLPEPIVIPERHEDDTPAKYLVRLEEAVSRGVVASVLSKGSDPFSQAVLRSYMRGFGFFGDPMDMAIRKLLMEVELPKETQQIDRCLQAFANRYHECNPGIYASPDQAYFIAFSLLILHTDVFNKNNKHKMQKPDYLKNTQGEGIFDHILECFYDNISYTPFIHVEDDLDINGERIVPHKLKKKSLFGTGVVDPKKGGKDPIDPYTLIIDSKLDTLRPNLKDVMQLEEHYSYLGTAVSLDLDDLQKTFFKTGVLQIVSHRSRPDAFMSPNTMANPSEAGPGIVDIKITKVGLLWRKDVKKKKTRVSPWQEWGAILTGAQLYFFRNTAWIKSLQSQQEQHQRQGIDGTPVIFKPPLESFKPDVSMSTDDAVALLDSTYKKHKNAFIFVRHGGFEETFLADNEDEMNDWLAKLNYAAAFRTAGVRMRGVVGGNYEGQRSRGIRRMENGDSAVRVQTPTGDVSIVSGKIDAKMAQDILAARREIMLQKIFEAEERLVVAQKQLDAQLRNARHLQILAPIQPKTRDQVITAAGRMAAKLKWVRMEMWRLKCHRDIMFMDLNDEGMIPETPKQKPVESSSPLKDLLTRAESKTGFSIGPPDSPPMSSSGDTLRRPSTHSALEHGVGDIFSTPPAIARSSSFHKNQASWELPPLVFGPHGKEESITDTQTTSPRLRNMDSTASMRPVATPDKPVTPTIDAAELLLLAQAGVEQGSTPDGKHTSASDADKARDDPDKERQERNKIRRSLHRTLRDAHPHLPTHHRSRKGKDSNSSAGLSSNGLSSEDVPTDDVLSRGTGSFTVHGKKASVITFGTELQSMSPEERLRLRRQARGDEGGISSSALENDFASLLAEPVEYHRRESAASGSTATAKSFRELRSRRGVMSDEESEGASITHARSVSEGRRSAVQSPEGSRPTTRDHRRSFLAADSGNSHAESDEKRLVEEYSPEPV